MNFDTITDADLNQLREVHKKVTNPTVKWKEKPGHRQKNHKVESDAYIFRLYLRQNTFDSEDFSCGLSVIKPDGTPLTLARYNGPSHKHGDITYQCHIHKATQAAIEQGKKPEHHAEATNRYDTLDGALYHLREDYNISGISGVNPDQTSFI